MDLRKLSDRVDRWMTAVGRADVFDEDKWFAVVDIIDCEMRLSVGGSDDDAPVPPPYADDAEFVAEGRAIFDELSKLTDSPLRARHLRNAMEAYGRCLVPSFSLRGGPALVVVRGGAVERPSDRFIDSADDAPKAG